MKTRTPQQGGLTPLTSVLGITRWWSTYDPSKFRSDLLAGFALVAFTVPEDMAYASLAGLPPQTRLGLPCLKNSTSNCPDVVLRCNWQMHLVQFVTSYGRKDWKHALAKLNLT
ncbi:MAG: hypothetical protein JOZ78_25745 [Chroococcidiopsidaceae cyanobacterium CP_BM_ER_R8_30]|nr:hypothetical protein [Chroococcidiopsidaceae cyanobacterium CP_BM_ER_R8_30]